MAPIPPAVPAPTMPAAPAGPEGSPAVTEEPPGGNGARPPTPETGTAATTIARQQENGTLPRDILAANTSPAALEMPDESPPVASGSIASPDVTATNPPPAEVPPAAHTPLPIENAQHTEGINHLLGDGAKYFLGRQDRRMIAMAAALRASPKTALGTEIRHNALLMLRAIEPRKGLSRFVDGAPKRFADTVKTYDVTSDENESTQAMASFLQNERDALDPAIQDSIPTDLIRGVRMGNIAASDLSEHLRSMVNNPQMNDIRQRFNRAVTGDAAVSLPAYTTKDLLHAAGIKGIDWVLHKRNADQILHPNHRSLTESLGQAMPLAFMVFLTITGFFQEEKQGRQ